MILAQASTAGISAAYGLFPADDFDVSTGECADRSLSPVYAALPQAMWYFREETIAVPCSAHPVAGLDPYLPAIDDLRQWNARTPPGSVRDFPALVWVGSPQVIESARLDASGDYVQTADGLKRFELSPRLAANRSYYNAASAAFFSRHELRLRGAEDAGRFVARTLWPADFRLDPAAPLKPLAAMPQALREFVRSEPQGGAQSAFATRVIWRRSQSAALQRAGRPLIGLMLNGAQGDDDEAHGGHFGLLTGRVGPQGQMHDWLVANYYTLDSESEKGILPAMVPLDNYLADLNSGQAWYRPSCMLVATLRDERTAAHLSSALARVFNQFYRHQFVYHHAAANCTGICVSILRALGWQVPVVGATSWWKAFAALPTVSLASGSLNKGKASFDYLTEDQTRLLPAVAFEQVGADLLQLVGGSLTRTLTPFEELLRQDVEEILLVRIPQLPSSRVWGDYPVASVAEYRSRLPKNRAELQIIPVDPRPFPSALKDPVIPRPERQRSDYAVAASVAGLMLLGGVFLRNLMRCDRSQSERRDG